MQLYLGLDPHSFPNALHYPVIRTEFVETSAFRKALQYAKKRATHLLFTSQQAVLYWYQNAPLFSHTVLSVGPFTTHALHLKGQKAYTAPYPSQEGVIQLLDGLHLENAFFLYPHSDRARPNLLKYLYKRGIETYAFCLYKTVLQAPDPVPQLETISEIVFTSPSTVDGFMRIFGKIPKDKKLISIGPVTQKALDKYLN